MAVPLVASCERGIINRVPTDFRSLISVHCSQEIDLTVDRVSIGDADDNQVPVSVVFSLSSLPRELPPGCPLSGVNVPISGKFTGRFELFYKAGSTGEYEIYSYSMTQK